MSGTGSVNAEASGDGRVIPLNQVLQDQSITIDGKKTSVTWEGRHISVLESEGNFRRGRTVPTAPRKDIMNLFSTIQKYMEAQHQIPPNEQKINTAEIKKLLLSMKKSIEGRPELKEDAELHQTIAARLKEVDATLVQLKAAPKVTREKKLSSTLQTKLQRAGKKALQIYKDTGEMAVEVRGGKMTKKAKENRAFELHETYHSEVLDSQHRYGGVLYDLFEVWKTSKSTDDFETWLNRVAAGENVPGAEETMQQRLVKATKVSYLGENQRKEYEMQVDKDGRISTQHDGVLHSANLPRKVDYMFVVSPDNKVYIGRKEKDMFHSSFLSGGALKSAGLLTIVDGKITSVTDSSGHYKPDDGMMKLAEATFKAKGVDLKDAKWKSVYD